MKKIAPSTHPGLTALKKQSPETVNKMGYMKKGGKVGMRKGGLARRKRK